MCTERILKEVLLTEITRIHSVNHHPRLSKTAVRKIFMRKVGKKFTKLLQIFLSFIFLVNPCSFSGFALEY